MGPGLKCVISADKPLLATYDISGKIKNLLTMKFNHLLALGNFSC
jgi:hypothetical protein